MNLPMLIGIAGILISLGVMAFLALTAPEGWEDDDGFHLGRGRG